MLFADWIISKQDLTPLSSYSDAASFDNAGFYGYDTSLGVGLLVLGLQIWAVKSGTTWQIGSPLVNSFGTYDARYIGNNKWILASAAIMDSGDDSHLALQIIHVDPSTLDITLITTTTFFIKIYDVDISVYFSHTGNGSFSELIVHPYMAILSDGRIVVSHSGEGFFDLTANTYRRTWYTRIFTISGDIISEQRSIKEDLTSDTINSGGQGEGLIFVYDLNPTVAPNSFIRTHLRGPGASVNNRFNDSILSIVTVDGSGNLTEGVKTRTNIDFRFSASAAGFFFGTGIDGINNPEGNDHIIACELEGNVFTVRVDREEIVLPQLSDDFGFYAFFSDNFRWVGASVYSFCQDISSPLVGAWHLNSLNVNTGAVSPKASALSGPSSVSPYVFPLYLDITNGVVTLLSAVPNDDNLTGAISVLKFPENPPVVYSANVNTTRVGFRSPTSRRNL